MLRRSLTLIAQVPPIPWLTVRTQPVRMRVPAGETNSFTGGPTVRIRFPPAKSPRRTAPAVGAGTPLRKGGTDGSNPVPSSGESSELPYCAAGSSDLVEHQPELLISLPRGSSDPPFSNTCLATVRDALHAENAVTHAEGPKGWTDLSANLDQTVTCRAR